MSNQSIPTGPAESPSTQMLAVLGGIAMLSGLLVVSVFQYTKPYIEANQLAATQRAIFKVVKGAVSHREFIVTDTELHVAAKDEQGARVYAGYSDKGKLLGIAVRSGAQGYADMIHIIYGYDPYCQCVRGFEVLKTAETPGLGDKISTDEAFLKNFDALDARLNPAGDDLANDIVTVKPGSKKHNWQIDAISGATISSRAIGKAINVSAKKLAPMLQRHLKALEQPPVTTASPNKKQDQEPKE